MFRIVSPEVSLRIMCCLFQRPAIPSDCDQSLSDLIQRCWVDDYKVVKCVCIYSTINFDVN